MAKNFESPLKSGVASFALPNLLCAEEDEDGDVLTFASNDIWGFY